MNLIINRKKTARKGDEQWESKPNWFRLLKGHVSGTLAVGSDVDTRPVKVSVKDWSVW